MVLISLVSKANAGKGTQLNLLSSTIGKKFAVTSVGDQLRKEVAEQTPLGKQAHSYMPCGAPLKKREDDKTEVVQKRLKDYDLKTYPVLDVFKAAGIPVFTIDNTEAKNSHQEFVNVVTHK